MIKHLGLKAYGKVNLGLDVVRRREDGYHEVRMIMQTVGIYDRIDLMRREQPGIGIETNLYYLPDNENNLAYKAARLLMDEFDIKEGVNIRIKKFIPVAAGMAGKSPPKAAKSEERQHREEKKFSLFQLKGNGKFLFCSDLGLVF